MNILEFEIPSFYMPNEPYWIKDLGLIVLSTNNVLPATEYYQPRYFSKLILFDYDPVEFKKTVIDFIIFSNFLNQNYPLMWWLHRKSLNDSTKYLKEINDLDKYVNDTFVKTDWYMTIDFNDYPLLELRQEPSKINFKENFVKFSNLKSDHKYQSNLRNLIDFFSFNYLSSMILNRIYNNTNLQINNSFIMIESLIKIEGIDQKGFETCPNCKYKIPKKKKMLELIKEYIKTKTDNTEIQNVFFSILKEHYKVRNDFSHTATYGNGSQKITDMLKKLGRNDFTLKDEIEYANASHQGVYIINSFIRIELLNKLENLEINNSST
jgi:hypothetical protein